MLFYVIFIGVFLFFKYTVIIILMRKRNLTFKQCYEIIGGRLFLYFMIWISLFQLYSSVSGDNLYMFLFVLPAAITVKTDLFVLFSKSPYHSLIFDVIIFSLLLFSIYGIIAQSIIACYQTRVERKLARKQQLLGL